MKIPKESWEMFYQFLAGVAMLVVITQSSLKDLVYPIFIFGALVFVYNYKNQRTLEKENQIKFN